MVIFPFRVNSYDNGYHIIKPWQDDRIFLKYKPKGFTWYAYDIKLLSKTRARFTVYKIKDYFYGGIGEVDFEFECEVEERDTKSLIERYVMKLSREIEEGEEQKRRKSRVSEIYKSIMGEV